MKLLILAAGRGSRLSPYTDDRPKCMVPYKEKPIIDHILDTAFQFPDISEIAIVGGYKKEILESHLKGKNIKFYTNKEFATSNMVHSLFAAESFLDDEIIISYSDIIYKKEILELLIHSKGALNVIVDSEWKNLWSKRMEDPLDDAETLKIANGIIIELGKKPKSYDDIEGQYIGLIKISRDTLIKLKKFYNSLNKNIYYDGQNYKNMYMTTLIQLAITHLVDVSPVFISGGWIEIDTVSDLALYKNENFLLTSY